MALPITRYVNRISKYTNKLSMTVLALIISVLILVKSLAESLESLLLYIWILFLILSFFFVLNGFLLVYIFNREINYYKQQGKPIRGLQGFDELRDALYKSRFESFFITLASVLAFTLFLLTSDVIEVG